MNRKQKTRLIGIVTLLIIVSTAITLILYALKQNINLFYTPTELMHAQIAPEQTVRIGGYVKQHSVHYNASGESVTFVMTDRSYDINVSFNGILPSLFREGQVVVVTGKVNPQHTLIANEVLAKHDEKYMPRPLAEKLKRGNSNGT
jgi:cytochrome c-type biogenesis protein CcmE